jgi:hypothetical protein
MVYFGNFFETPKLALIYGILGILGILGATLSRSNNYALIFEKMDWATFWAISSQSHRVTLRSAAVFQAT